MEFSVFQKSKDLNRLEYSFYAYIRDRISETNQIPPLATLVTIRARELHLGWSWA